MKTLSLSLLVVLLLSVIGLGWTVDQIFSEFLADERNSPVTHYETLGKQLASGLNASDDPDAFLQAWQTHPGTQVSLLTQQQLPLPAELWQPLQQGQPLILETENGLTLHYWLARHARVLAMAPQALRNDQQQTLIYALLSTGFYLGIALLMLIWLLPLVHSLRRLRQNARSYGRGDFSTRLPPRRLSYIGDIERTFNRMADQIETLLQDNRLISSAVSHDLRTPLARLRFGIDMLSDTDDEQQRRKYQEHLSNDIDEMQSLVEALLNFARLEQNLIELEKKPVDLLPLLQDFQANHPNGLVQLECQEPALTTSGEKTYLRMLLHNILNNALFYGDQAVLVQAKHSGKQIVICIHDDGPGIEPELIPTLFKPFVRGDTSHAHQGFGMGLAIAERIAHWHDGEITAGASSRLKGTEFIVRLPHFAT